MGDGHRPHQVGEENDASLEDAHEERIPAGVGARDPGPEFGDARRDPLGRDQDLDLADLR